MTKYIAEQFVQALVARADIVDVLSQKINLKKAGNHYSALCPFHQEKTPSFSVNQHKQFYYCFGCGASGDVLQFLMEHDRLTFPEAVAYVADHLGIPLEYEKSESKAYQLDPLYEALAVCQQYYTQQLRVAVPAITYLKARGITGQMAKQFALGFAPVHGHSLKKQAELDVLVEAGLLVSPKNYARFRDRIIFPIRDPRGRVLAFGGRALSDTGPKYLNSPETAVFQKRRCLYGLFEVLQRIRRPEFIIVVEGYFDVINLVQANLAAVATLGTAVSIEHLELVFKYTNEVIFCFDGDKAGRTAAWRALEQCLPLMTDMRRVKFLFLADGQDPDSYVRQQGEQGFLTALKQAEPLSGVFFGHFLQTTDLVTLEGRAHFVALVTPLLKKLPEGLFKNMMHQRMTELLGESTQTIKPPKLMQKKHPVIKKQAAPTSLLLKASALLLQNRDFLQFVPANVFILKDFELFGLDFFIWLVNILNKEQDIGISDLQAQAPVSLTGVFQQALQVTLFSIIPEQGVKDEFIGAMEYLQRCLYEQELSKLLLKAQANLLSDTEKIELKNLLAVSKPS